MSVCYTFGVKCRNWKLVDLVAIYSYTNILIPNCLWLQNTKCSAKLKFLLSETHPPFRRCEVNFLWICLSEPQT